MTLSGHTLALEEEARTSARRIFALISHELEEVEAEFERQASSNVQVIIPVNNSGPWQVKNA